jgi:hypothetical protein
MPKRKKPGQPPRHGIGATERIEIRLTLVERKAWEYAAAQAGVTVSEWVRMRCATGGAA